MKKINKVLLLCSIAILVISCGLDMSGLSTPQAVKPFAEEGERELRVAYDMTDAEFGIKMNTDWFVTTDEVGWVETFTSYGKKEDSKIVMKFSGNPSETSYREQTFYVRSVQDEDYVIELSLKQAPFKYLTTEQNRIDIDGEGGTCYIDIVSNVDWTVSSSSEIALSKTSGHGSQTIVATVSMTKEFVERELQITVSTDDEIEVGKPGFSKVIPVYQAAAVPTFDATPDQFKVSASTTSVCFTIKENVGYTLHDCAGVSYSISETVFGHEVTATFEENTTENYVEYTIRITPKVILPEISSEKYVIIKQKGVSKVADYDFATGWYLTPAIVKTANNTQDYSYTRAGSSLDGVAHLKITTGRGTANWTATRGFISFYRNATTDIHPYFTFPAISDHDIESVCIFNSTQSKRTYELRAMDGTVLETTALTKGQSKTFDLSASSGASGYELHLTDENAQYDVNRITVTYSLK